MIEINLILEVWTSCLPGICTNVIMITNETKVEMCITWYICNQVFLV